MTTSKRPSLLSNISFSELRCKFAQWRGQTDEDFARSLFHIIEFRSNPLVALSSYIIPRGWKLMKIPN